MDSPILVMVLFINVTKRSFILTDIFNLLANGCFMRFVEMLFLWRLVYLYLLANRLAFSLSEVSSANVGDVEVS